MANDALSFATDIRPLFTDTDVDHMKPFGIDLSDYADVKKNAAQIYAVVTAGTMPPSSPWDEATCAKFGAWQSQGCPP